MIFLIKYEIYYTDNKKHGLYKSFREDQTVSIEGSFDSNLKNGDWVYYNNKGDTLAVYTYKNDIIEKYSEYDND